MQLINNILFAVVFHLEQIYLDLHEQVCNYFRKLLNSHSMKNLQEIHTNNYFMILVMQMKKAVSDTIINCDSDSSKLNTPA